MSGIANHARFRFRERFGASLSKSMVDRLFLAISTGIGGQLIRAPRPQISQEHWRVYLPELGRSVIAVVRDGGIISFLTDRDLERQRHRWHLWDKISS